MNNELNKLDNDTLLKSIVEETYTEDMVKDITEKEKTINQVKLFTLVRTKRELQRVLKFNEMLTKVEEAFNEKLDDCIDRNIFGIAEYSSIIMTINSILDRSDKIIQRVLNDDSLSNVLIIQNNDNSSLNIGNTTNNILGLSDPQSRDRVNKVVSNVINMLNKVEENPDDLIIDENNESEGDYSE